MFVWLMVFNAFQLYHGGSVLLMEETRGPGENHLSQVTDKHCLIEIRTHTIIGDRHRLHW